MGKCEMCEKEKIKTCKILEFRAVCPNCAWLISKLCSPKIKITEVE